MANLRRILTVAALLLGAVLPASAQTYLRYSNWCQKGGQRVMTSGIGSVTRVQASYPGCLITVYNAGTLTKPFLFSNKLGTPLANPFTASTSDGSFFFYVNAAAHYDIVTSGGGIPSPYTVFDYVITDSGGGGGGGSVTGVTATAPVQSTGGTAPIISLPQATAAQAGYLAAADWAAFNAKGPGTVQSVQLAAPATGFSVTGGPITGSGTLTLSYNGQFPTTSVCSGSPTNLTFCNGSGAWLPALTYLGASVLTLTPGTNIAFTPSGNNVAISATSAVTFPVLAPSGSSTSAQYSFTAHPETGLASALVGSQLPIEQVQVTAATGPSNIIITTSNAINPLSWASGLTFQLASLPATNALNTLNGLDFTAASVANNQTCPNGYAALACGTITFSATTSVAIGTYATSAGSASNYAGYFVGHDWTISRLPSSTSNPARTGTVQGARRDAWVFRCGAIDDTGIDCPALRGGAVINSTNGVGTGKMRVNGAASSGASSISINKAAGSNWSAVTGDYIFIDRQNGDATLQRYKVTSPTTVTAGGNTSVPISPNLRTTMLGGELVVAASWSRAQLGDGNGVEVLGDLYLADATIFPDGCLNIASGLVGSTGIACGAGSSVAGSPNDIQLNVAAAFGVDTGIFTYTPGTSTLKVRNVLVNGAASQQNRWLYTVGGVTLTAGGAGTTVWGVDTDGFIKFCENNGACVRPGTGAGSGNLISSGSPTTGQTAEFITDAFHLTGVANTGTGSYVKGTAPTITGGKYDLLNDTSAHAALTLAATVNAVDSFQMISAATANPATITLSAIGSDANISINIAPKGSGIVQCAGLPCGGGGSSYTNLFQTDANTLTQRNSGVPQTLQVMNTYTDAANFQGLVLGDQFIKTFRAGTGSNRSFQFGVDSSGTLRGWQVNASFNLLPANNASGGIISNFFQSSSLLDANGAPFLASSATASAVNAVTIVNSATGQPVQVQATGADANISLNLVSKGTGVVLCNGVACSSGGGGSGTVTSFASGNLSPLFTTNVTTASTTPTQTFTLIAAAANSLFGNNTAASGSPAYFTAALTALPFGREGTLTSLLHGNPSGTFSFGPVNFATDGTGIVPSANLCAGTPTAATFCNGIGQWATPSGGGNVSVTGTTPVNLQAAEWASGSTIRAVNVTGSGSYAKATSPLLVTPQVNTILDANGAPFLTASATASAVDGLTVTNSATGSPATVGLTASGTDPNINLLLSAKGTGLVQVNGALQTSSALTGAWQATQGLDPGLALAGKDLFWASSVNNYWTMSNNGGAAQKVIGSGVDINTSDQVIGSHFPHTNTGDLWIYNGSTWTQCPGNTSGTQFLTESAAGSCSWSPGTSSVAWSSLLPPASTTNLSMAGFTSTFSYTSALQNAFAWLNTTAATSAGGGTNANSPTVSVQGNYWSSTGPASAPDIWQWQDVLTNGSTNGASTLTFIHAGSSGLALVSAPGYKTTSIAASTPHYLSAQATCTGFGIASFDAICGDSTAWKMSIGGATVVPFVSGPSAAPTTGNLTSFTDTTGSKVQDTGIAAGTVPTAAAVIASGNVVQGSGGVRGLSDAGYAANTVVTSAAVIAAGNLPAGTGGVRAMVDSGLVAAQVNFSAANITTDDLVTGAANTRQVKDSGVLITSLFTTATKADVLETGLRCLDAGSTDAYACNLSPAISAYVTGTLYGFKANTANTNAATVAFNGLSALTIKKMFGGTITSDLATNDILAGQWVYCVYDGINCQMTSQLGNAPSGTGTVTSIVFSAPLSGGTISTTGTVGCATCVTSGASLTSGQPLAGSGSQGIQSSNFSGDVTTSGTMATTIAANAVTAAKSAVVLTRRTCDMAFGDTSGSALTNAQLGPQKRICYIPFAATIVEMDVAADAGTPNIIVAVNHAGTPSNIVSGALATAASGGIACSKTTGVTGLDGATTCSATLQNTSIAIGDYLEAVSGTAGGTAKLMTVHVIYLVN